MLWRHKMHIDPTNNASGLEVKKSGFWRWKKVTLTAVYSNSENQQVILPCKTLLKDLLALQNGKTKDYGGNLRRMFQNGDELYLYFKPVNHCDLVVLKKQDLVNAIK